MGTMGILSLCEGEAQRIASLSCLISKSIRVAPTRQRRAGYSNLRGYATNRVAVALIVVERGIDVRAAEVEVAGSGGKEDGRRPISAEDAQSVERAIAPAAAIHK